jgi:hypothetical protein
MIELTPQGVGGAVRELMGNGMSLDEAVKTVSRKLSSTSEFLESDLIEWMVRHAEHVVFQQCRPIAIIGNNEGHPIAEAHDTTASVARSYFKANPHDFLVAVRGGGRKRLGDLTRPDVRKIADYYKSYKKTYASKELKARKVFDTMVNRNATIVEDLGDVTTARLLLGGADS